MYQDSTEGLPKALRGWQKALGLLVITHDKAATNGDLGRMLKSARPFVSQISVCDTSFEPSSKVFSVAAGYGAMVTHRPWDSSFANARNAAAKQLTTDWIMSLDSDEELIATPEVSANVLANLLTNADAGCYSLALLNIDEGGEHLMPIGRIARNNEHYVWKSRVHEYVDGIRTGMLANGGVVPGLTLRHHGHGAKAAIEFDKTNRNRTLGQMQLADNPNDPYSWFVAASTDDKMETILEWRKLISWAAENPFELDRQGWLRHALTDAMRKFAFHANLIEAARLNNADSYWRTLADLCASVRSLMPGIGFADLTQMGGGEARYWHALALLKMKDYAASLDVITPIVATTFSIPFASTEAKWLGRYEVFMRASVEVGHTGTVEQMLTDLMAQSEKEMPRANWRPKIEKMYNDLMPRCKARAEAFQAYLKTVPGAEKALLEAQANG